MHRLECTVSTNETGETIADPAIQLKHQVNEVIFCGEECCGIPTSFDRICYHYLWSVPIQLLQISMVKIAKK